MAKLPSYVAQAINADRAVQLNVYATVTAYVFGEVKADREVKELGDKLFTAGPHRSLKTWQNYASACMALAKSQSVALERMWAENQDAAAVAASFAVHLTACLKGKGHTHAIEDVARFAAGKSSLKAKAKAEAEEQKRVESENAAAALAATTEAARIRATTPPAPAPEPVADTRETAPNGEENSGVQTGYPSAIQETAQATANLVVHACIREGKMDVSIGEAATRDDIQALIDLLQTELDSMPVAETAEAA